MTEVVDVAEPTPTTWSSSPRNQRVAIAIGGAGLVALVAAIGLFIATYKYTDKPVAPAAPSVVASAPAPAPEPPATPAASPAPAMFSTAPKPAQNAMAFGATSQSAATLPDFSLPKIDWPGGGVPDFGVPTVDWSNLVNQVSAANNAQQAGNIVGGVTGTAGSVFSDASSIVGDLILASAYNQNNGNIASLDPVSALLAVMAAPPPDAAVSAAVTRLQQLPTPTMPDFFAGLRNLPPIASPGAPDLTKLPPPPDLSGLSLLALPPPPDLTKLPPLALPPPPDLMSLPSISLPPPPSIGLPSLHLWPFF